MNLKEKKKIIVKMLNNNGSNIEPWGTPAIMFSQVSKLLFTVTEQLLEMNSTQFKFNCQSKQNILIWNISDKKKYYFN